MVRASGNRLSICGYVRKLTVNLKFKQTKSVVVAKASSWESVPKSNCLRNFFEWNLLHTSRIRRE